MHYEVIVPGMKIKRRLFMLILANNDMRLVLKFYNIVMTEDEEEENIMIKRSYQVGFGRKEGVRKIVV